MQNSAVSEIVFVVLCLIVVAFGDFLPASVLMALAGALAVLGAPIFAVLSAMEVSNEAIAPLKWWGMAGYITLFLVINLFGIGVMYYLI